MFAPVTRSSAARGYDRAHQELRKHWEPIVEAGGVVCWRCRRPIVAAKRPQPDGRGGVRMVSNWHLGHSDDRRGYMGPEHDTCSVKAGARAGAKKANASPKRRSPRRRRRVFGPVSSSRSL